MPKPAPAPSFPIAGEQLIFGPFSLTPSARLLTRDGVPVEIGGRPLDLLTVLVQHPGRVMSKRELLNRVWSDVVVADGSLRFHMNGLRRVLGDGEAGARYIATQIGVGYAFVAPVRRSGSTRADSDAEPLNAEPRGAAQPEGSGLGRLPARPGRVIGRESDVRLLCARVMSGQLYTVVGPAGVGKTVLAIEAAHALRPAFSDMVSFVDLSALGAGDLVASAIAGALGITVQAEDPLAVILGHIRDEQLLLVLDNCEHLVDAVSAIVLRIREAAPRVGILATSREPLRVSGEHVHWLSPLDYPSDPAALSLEQLLAFPAVELFVERARAGDSAFLVDRDAAMTIGDLCRRLDGMALPIELTAVRAAAHGLASTARLIGERFSLAWTGLRTASPRQQTLQATLDWSYELLSEAERLAFDRLSVFRGPFSVQAALAVVAEEGFGLETAAAALDELTSKSLVSPDRWGDGDSYRLLEMTRTYAAAKLETRGSVERNATAARHARRVLDSLTRTALSDSNEDVDVDHSPQLGNIRSALEWSFGADGDLGIAVPLAAASAPVFLNLSLLVECRTWCARATASLDERHRGGPLELELQASLGLSLMFTRGNGEAAEKALRRALDLAEALGDRWNQLRVLGRLHIFHERIGDFETALDWAARAVVVADALGAPEAIAVAASLSGISQHLAGDQTRARRELEQSLRRSLPSERARTIYYGFDHRNRSGIALARTLWLQGQADEARRIAAQTLEAAGRLQHPVTYCIALIWTLSVDLWTGDFVKAQANLEAFAEVAAANAFGPYVAATPGFRGKLEVLQGRAGPAIGWLEESLARLHAMRYELLTTPFELALILGLSLGGRRGEALELAGFTIDRCRRNGELFALPEVLRIKAALLRAGGGAIEDVEALLVESMSLGCAQGAQAWVLRAAVDLAALRLDQDRGREALAGLLPVRARFSEGLDTADLRDADRLIERLVAAASSAS